MKDREFVVNELTCQSGFALTFYPDGGLKDPSSSGNNGQYSKYVSVNSIDV